MGIDKAREEPNDDESKLQTSGEFDHLAINREHDPSAQLWMSRHVSPGVSDVRRLTTSPSIARVLASCRPKASRSLLLG